MGYRTYASFVPGTGGFGCSVAGGSRADVSWAPLDRVEWIESTTSCNGAGRFGNGTLPSHQVVYIALPSTIHSS